MIKLVKLVIITFYILFFNSCTAISKTPPTATNGEIDLKNWNMETDGIIPLNGEWNFYWNRFVSFEDINGEKSPKASGLIQVPKDWNYFEVENQKINNYGYATYTLKVKNNSSNNLYLNLATIGTAYKLYIDK